MDLFYKTYHDMERFDTGGTFCDMERLDQVRVVSLWDVLS